MHWQDKLNTGKLVSCIGMLAIFSMAARLSVDTDTWWHLRAGEWIVNHAAILNTDQFSYTRFGEPWRYPGWLVEAPMYLIYRYLGPGGLNMWTALMVTLAFYFVGKTLKGNPFLRAFVLILAATVSGVYWAARPYLVTFALTAITLWIFERYRDSAPEPGGSFRRSGLGWLAVIMVIWVNSHGGFIIGFIVWGVYWLADSATHIKRAITNHRPIFSRDLWKSPLTLAGMVMVGAAFINPSGPAVLLYPLKTVGIGVLQEYIQEWQSPDFHSLSVQPFIWLILLTLAAVGISRRRIAFIDFALVALFAYLGLMAGRNIALFALAAPMVVTRHLTPVLSSLGRRMGIRMTPARPAKGWQRLLNGAILGVILLAALAKATLVYPRAANEQAFEKSLPVQAVEYLKIVKPPGRMFNSYNWGGYLIWALREYPVFADGRTDLYDDEILEQWLQVARAEAGWLAILDRWDIQLFVIEPGLPVADILADYGWIEIYRDDLAVIFRDKH